MKTLVGGDCVVAIMMSVAALLLGCSSSGGVVLHNASGADIEVFVLDYQYRLSSSETKRVSIDPGHGMQDFRIRTRGVTRCYVMPRVETKWFHAGLIGRVFLLLDESGRLYLYSPDSGERHFHERAPPVQPPGFPLEASTQDGCHAP